MEFDVDYKYVRYTIVGEDAQWDVLYDSDGVPVMPLSNLDELAALNDRLTGCAVRLIEAHSVSASGKSNLPPKCGVVAWTSTDQEALSRLYGHLTNRDCASWDEVGKAPQAEPVLTIIASRATFDTELIESAADMVHSQAMLPGFIYASEPRDLRLHALTASCLHGASLSLNQRRGDYVDSLPLARANTALREMMGGTASNAQVQKFLQERYATLALSTHSDGIDAKLSSAMLCALRGTSIACKGERVPACVHTGTCHRRGTPLAQIESDPALLDPSSIACGLLIMHTCYGLLHKNGYVSTEWSLFDRLIENPNIPAAAYHLNLSEVSSPDILSKLLEDLYQGIPIGLAFGELMRSERAHRYGIRFVLIGDPSSRAVTYPDRSKVEQKWHVLAAPKSSPDIQTTRDQALAYAWKLAHHFCPQASTVLGCGSIDDPETWLDNLCENLSGWDALHTHLHSPTSAPAHAKRAEETCFHCGHRYFHRILSPAPDYWRTVLRCENCGAGSDHSTPAQIDLRISGSTPLLEIRNKGFEGLFHARLLITSKCYGRSVIRRKVSPLVLTQEGIRIALDDLPKEGGPSGISLIYLAENYHLGFAYLKYYLPPFTPASDLALPT